MVNSWRLNNSKLCNQNIFESYLIYFLKLFLNFHFIICNYCIQHFMYLVIYYTFFSNSPPFNWRPSRCYSHSSFQPLSYALRHAIYIFWEWGRGWSPSIALVPHRDLPRPRGAPFVLKHGVLHPFRGVLKLSPVVP